MINLLFGVQRLEPESVTVSVPIVVVGTVAVVEPTIVLVQTVFFRLQAAFDTEDVEDVGWIGSCFWLNDWVGNSAFGSEEPGLESTGTELGPVGVNLADSINLDGCELMAVEGMVSERDAVCGLTTCFCLVTSVSLIVFKIWLAVSIDIPQKSGTKCEQAV
ncbi:hypothetical protein WICPIJ_005251 [Wickerhamomyces pijperi]|uniref:Uncharacterized protein n=1 Tax=Wickerhamomyces pijperi TaxID=599730 RepID=A0A9P8TM01_WICPI|nr:hypothetical protein WICPIJ_005251 [Wickerhamomyces pijperi]